MSIREALASSFNVPAVAVLDDIGTSSMIELAARAGVDLTRREPGTRSGGDIGRRRGAPA
ncbi:MAG: hypothetical protein HND48_13885 [Chloroflexi bacterium]|nr:hypothetical protein [Chloroflexota bacterium]